jgi:hypothetical protein
MKITSQNFNEFPLDTKQTAGLSVCDCTVTVTAIRFLMKKPHATQVKEATSRRERKPHAGLRSG